MVIPVIIDNFLWILSSAIRKEIQGSGHCGPKEALKMVQKATKRRNAA